MAETDQMSRQELLEARADVQKQIELLRTPVLVGVRHQSGRQPLIDKLNAILDEIEAELSELGTRDA